MTNPDNVTASVNDDDEPGDPDAIDTGDFTEVPEAERLDHDDDPPNADADDDLSDVDEGEVVDLEDSEDEDDDEEPEEEPDASGPPAQDEQGPSTAGG